jgi:hypothetical protein
MRGIFHVFCQLESSTQIVVMLKNESPGTEVPGLEKINGWRGLSAAHHPRYGVALFRFAQGPLRSLAAFF